MTASRESQDVVLPWRRGTHPLYVASVVTFLGVLLAIVFGRGQFQPIHKAAMLLAVAGLSYSLVVQFVNETRLSLVDGEVRVAHGPLPIRRGVVVPVNQIRTLRCDPNSRRLILRTVLGEELVLAENLVAADLTSIDGELRDKIGLGIPR